MKIYWIVLFAFSLSLIAGCAAGNATDYRLFHAQTGILAEETLTAVEEAELLAGVDLMESIAAGDRDLLESIILQRNGSFNLNTDSVTIAMGLSNSKMSVVQASQSLGVYTLLLSEAASEGDLVYRLASTGESLPAALAAAVAVIVEQGRITRDTEAIHRVMVQASPAVQSISETMAETIAGVAEAVHICYARMSARRQRQITAGGFPADTADIEDLLILNARATELLSRLEMLHDSWLMIPVVHSEITDGQLEHSVSATLRILAEKHSCITEFIEEGGEE